MKIWKVLLLVSFLVYAVQCAPEAQDAEPKKVEDTPKVEDTKEEETPTLEDEEDTEDEESDEENDEENDEEEQSDEEDKEEDNAVEQDEDEDAGRRKYRKYKRVVGGYRRVGRCSRPVCPFKRNYYLRKLCYYGLRKAARYGKRRAYLRHCKCYRRCRKCKKCRWCVNKKYGYRYKRYCYGRRFNCWCRNYYRYYYPKPRYG